MKHLILGGARSGKSRFAEQLAEASGKQVVYLATAQSLDEEMAERIAQHQAQRPSHWETLETPLQLADSLRQQAAAERCLLVDCLTLWLSNQLMQEADETSLAAQLDELVELIPQLPGEVLLVSNEVGQGVVPMGELSRRFVDTAGKLHQRLAQQCDQVTFIVAGLPHKLKG